MLKFCFLCPQNYLVRKKAKKSNSVAHSSDNGEVTDESSQLIIPSITRDEKVYQPGEYINIISTSCYE